MSSAHCQIHWPTSAELGAIYHTIAVDLGILDAIRRDGDDPVRAAKREGIEDAEV